MLTEVSEIVARLQHWAQQQGFPTVAEEKIVDDGRSHKNLGKGSDASFSADCEALANTLLAWGATGAAARWRTMALLPPPSEQLLAALREIEGELHIRETDSQTSATSMAGAPADPLTHARNVLEGSSPWPRPAEVAVMAQALLQAGDSTTAIDLVRRQAVAGGLAPDLCTTVASLLAQLEQWWDAERWLTAAMRHSKNQKNSRQCFLLSRLLLELEIWDEAFEAVQQGLAEDPESDWGRNLRARILLSGGAWRSFDRLAATPGALPTDPSLYPRLEELRRRWSRSGLGSAKCSTPEPLTLSQRLALRIPCPKKMFVVLVHGNLANPLPWLVAQELVPAGAEVQPISSREPLELSASLASAGFDVHPERPSSWLEVLIAERKNPIDLLILQRPKGALLPIRLGSLLTKVSRLLAPIGLLDPPHWLTLCQRHGWGAYIPPQ